MPNYHKNGCGFHYLLKALLELCIPLSLGLLVFGASSLVLSMKRSLLGLTQLEPSLANSAALHGMSSEVSVAQGSEPGMVSHRNTGVFLTKLFHLLG